MNPAPRLTPFSYVVLTLIGRSGATAPELVEMMSRGRLYWTAPRSQWYAEPKRLAEAGLLSAAREPGETTDRTRYAITKAGTKAVEAWLRTPAHLPVIKNETVVRVMAADLVGDPSIVLDGLRAELPDEIAAVRADVAHSRQRAAELGDRKDRLLLQHELTAAILKAYERYLTDVERLLGAS
jgi:DNA-binding PadR family transcriptional regulator